MKRYLTALLLALPLTCMAEQPPPPLEPLPDDDAPPIPSGTDEAEELEPEVTIIESDKGTIYEYRANGALYMVKVQPASGPPYYLLDTDGDGQMDVRQNRPWDNHVPQWVLFRF